GDPDILKIAGVPLVAASPGVGGRLRRPPDDSLLVPQLPQTGRNPRRALVYNRMGSPEELNRVNNPMLGWNGQEVQGRARPSDAEVAALGPAFVEAWNRDFEGQPNKPVAVFTAMAGFPGDPSLATGDPGLAMSVFTVYPLSRGHVHITGPKLDDPLDFEAGMLSDDVDVKKHLWMYEKQREVMRRMGCYRGEMAACHPPFAADSAARCVRFNEGVQGLAVDGKDIEHTAEDDQVIQRWIRENVGSGWHPLDACKMLPREQNGVVDAASLGVYGVGRLKVADMSIVPRNVTANTNNTALAIGEKAADIFIKELSSV
ncbi:GMC oxidoreductase-domain-containing protein, partial [Apodospora peruviana]